MTTYTVTPEQSAVIVARWNKLANEDNQIDSGDAYILFGDNFDDDLEQNGAHQVEVRASKSKTGNPATFYIMEEEVTAE